METLRQRHLRLLGAVVVFSSALPVMAFELLTEGAMDTVSAVSANSAEEIVSVAGSASAGLRVEEGYEQLPLVDEGVKLEGYSVEDASEELTLTLSKEVEVWAESVREGATSNVQVQVGYVDQLPPSREQEFKAPIFDESSVVDLDVFEVSSDTETSFQVGRITQTFELIDSGVESISYGLKRFIDYTSTEHSRPSDDRDYMGSGYVTNLTSESFITIAGARD